MGGIPIDAGRFSLYTDGMGQWAGVTVTAPRPATSLGMRRLPCEHNACGVPRENVGRRAAFSNNHQSSISDYRIEQTGDGGFLRYITMRRIAADDELGDEIECEPLWFDNCESWVQFMAGNETVHTYGTPSPDLTGSNMMWLPTEGVASDVFS